MFPCFYYHPLNSEAEYDNVLELLDGKIHEFIYFYEPFDQSSNKYIRIDTPTSIA